MLTQLHLCTDGNAPPSRPAETGSADETPLAHVTPLWHEVALHHWRRVHNRLAVRKAPCDDPPVRYRIRVKRGVLLS